MKKKILSALLMSTLLLGLTACGGASEDAKNNDIEIEQESVTATEESEATFESTDDLADASEEKTGIRAIVDASSLTSKDVTVRIGVQGEFITTLADQLGWYDEIFGPNNIKFELIRFNNGPELNEAISAGEVDLGGMGLQPSISGVANGAEDVVVYSYMDQSAGTVIVTGENSDIKSIEDLKGKKVATTIGSSAHSLLLTSLKAHGLSQADVEIINVGDFSALATVVQTGEVDAAAGYSTVFTSVTNSDGYEFTLLEDASDYGVAYLVTVATTSFVEQYPDIVETLIKLYDYETKWMYENTEETLAEYAEYYGIDVEAARAYFESGIYRSVEEEELRRGYTNYIDFMVENGLLVERIEVDEIIDLTYSNNALGR